MTTNLWVVIFAVELCKKWIIVINHTKEINKTNIIFIETSFHLMNGKCFRNFRVALNIIRLLQQFIYWDVSWCYAVDGLVCILRTTFCIFYQAFVRHNISIHFSFNRSAYTVHCPLAVMSFIVVPIYFHFAIYLRNQSKNISWWQLPYTLISPNVKSNFWWWIMLFPQEIENLINACKSSNTWMVTCFRYYCDIFIDKVTISTEIITSCENWKGIVTIVSALCFTLLNVALVFTIINI